MRIEGLLLLALSACRCTPETVPQPTHVPGYAPLVDAVIRDDGPAIEQWGDNLLGSDEDDDGGASMTIGAALGFLHVASAADERALALVSLSRGCGECHAARGVSAPARPSASDHAAGAQWALYPLVWSGEPGTSEHPEASVRAAAPGGPEAVVVACQACHADGA